MKLVELACNGRGHIFSDVFVSVCLDVSLKLDRKKIAYTFLWYDVLVKYPDKFVLLSAQRKV